MSKKILLETIDLDKEYGEDEGKVVALNKVNLKVYDGELLVVLGSSGSGKSTLLNMLGGMDYPTRGKIICDNENICEYNDKNLTNYRKDKVGFVFQSFNLIQNLSAKENVEMALDKADKDKVEKVLKLVKLENKMDKYPKELSGGEQQRVSIARALVKDAPILLCDEPTGALDYETGKAILICLEELVRKYKKTIVLVTHTKEIGKMADRIVTMRNGKIVSTTINKTIKAAKSIEW